MVVGKVITKLIQSLPTWEVTKYYGRVCVYQIKCIKYKIQTSEAWFNFKCKFMPGSLRDQIECEEQTPEKSDKQLKENATEKQTNNVNKGLSSLINAHSKEAPKLKKQENLNNNDEYLIQQTKIGKSRRKVHQEDYIDYNQDHQNFAREERARKPRKKVNQQ